MSEIAIRKATPADLSDVKRIIDKNRRALGFVRSAELMRGIQEGEILVGEYDGETVGVLHFHHRRDGVTTIYHLVVAEEYRGRGFGRALVCALEHECRESGQNAVHLKCPADLDANGFYRHLGFCRMSIEPGKVWQLAVWEKCLE